MVRVIGEGFGLEVMVCARSPSFVLIHSLDLVNYGFKKIQSETNLDK